jgi:integrase
VVSIADAREKRDEMRRQLADGKSPAAVRQAEKVRQLVTFGAIAEEWLAMQGKTFAAATTERRRWLFDRILIPGIGALPVHEVSSQSLLACLRKHEARGHHETAHRARSVASQIFRYAIATGRAERDPARDSLGALAPVPFRHRAAITEPAKVGVLMRAIETDGGRGHTAAALRLLALTFFDPGSCAPQSGRNSTLRGPLGESLRRA